MLSDHLKNFGYCLKNLDVFYKCAEDVTFDMSPYPEKTQNQNNPLFFLNNRQNGYGNSSSGNYLAEYTPKRKKNHPVGVYTLINTEIFVI